MDIKEVVDLHNGDQQDGSSPKCVDRHNHGQLVGIIAASSKVELASLFS